MKLPNKIFRRIIKGVNKYYKEFVLGEDDPDQTPINKLVWVPKKLVPQKFGFFDSVDSIEFGIDKLPVQEELIFEVSTQAEAERIIRNIKLKCEVEQHVRARS